MQPHRDVAFAYAQRQGNVFYRHVFEIETCHRSEIFRQAPHSLDKAGQAHGMARCFIGRRGRIGQAVAQRLGLPHQSAPDMGDANILRDAGI